MLDNAFSVFTHNPECLYGASHIVISHGHYFNDKQYHKVCTTNLQYNQLLYILTSVIVL